MIDNYICKCKKFNFKSKNLFYWEDRSTTSDEIDIINFLKKNFNLRNKTLLHIGIGNSEIASKFSEIKKIFGITISNSEIQKAKKLNIKNYEVYLCDKYSKTFIDKIKDIRFDLLIDPNLKSYSCCDESFNFMMNNLIKVLSTNGIIITSRNGMNWYKKLKPKISFNFKHFFHFKLKEINGDQKNQLSINEIKKFTNYHKLSLTYDERVLYLKK